MCTLDPRVSDGVDRADLAPLLRLIRQRAYEPAWFDDGQAVIRFEDGSLLTYPAHPIETSWIFPGRYGETCTSGPGGRVVFDKDRPTSLL